MSGGKFLICMKGKSLFSIIGILGLSFTLFACGEKNDTTPPDTNPGSTPIDPTPDTSSAEDNLTEGPKTTEVPDDTATIPSDDPIYDDEPDEVDPVWPATAQTEPGQYNLYYATDSTTLTREMFWLWGGPSSGSGVMFSTSNVAVAGVDGVTFSAVYLNYGIPYYCYGSWGDSSSASETSFKITRDNIFNGCKIKDRNGKTSNADDVTLPAPTADAEQTNIYIFEKADTGEVKAFTDLDELVAFKNDETPAVALNTTTAPSDYNIYYYSKRNKNSNYLYTWSGAQFLAPATATTTVGSYSFNAIYIQYGVKYKVTKDFDMTTTGVVTFSSSNVFSAGLIRDKSGADAYKSADIKTTLKPGADGKFDIYLMENASGGVGAFATSTEALAFLDGSTNPGNVTGGDTTTTTDSSTPDTTTSNTPKSSGETYDASVHGYGVNVYVTAGKGSYNAGWAAELGNLWTWGGNCGAGASIVMDTTLKSVNGIDNYKFVSTYLEFNKDITVFTDWAQTTQGTVKFLNKGHMPTGMEARQNIAKSADQGSTGGKNGSVDGNNLVMNENGRYDLFLVIEWEGEEKGTTLSAFYSIDDFTDNVGTSTIA